MAKGFKIADGYVEVRGEPNRDQIRATAAKAGDEAGDHFTRALGNRLRSPHFVRGPFSMLEGHSRSAGQRFGAIYTDALMRQVSRNLQRAREEGIFDQWTKEARRVGEEGGREGGRGFMRGFGGWLVTPDRGVLAALRSGIAGWMASPLGLAGAAVAGVFIASFASAVISSASLALVGGAFGVLAGVALRENERIQDAWVRTGRRINSSLANSAESLAGTFVAAGDRIGSHFVTRVEPRLEQIFEGLAPGVDDLVDGSLGAVDRFLARIAPNAEALTEGFLVPMAEQLPRLGESAGNFVETLILNGPTIAEAFEGVVTITDQFLRVLDDVLVVGSQVFNFFVGWNDFVRSTPLWDFMQPGGLLRGPFAKGFEFRDWVIDQDVPVLSHVASGFGMIRTEAQRAAESSRNFTDIGEDLWLSLQRGVIQSDRFGNSMIHNAESMGQAIVAAGGLADALAILTGGTLAARAAERQFQEAIDEANEALEEHGLNLDVTTEEGRLVESTLDAIAQAAIRKADGVYQSLRAEVGHTTALEAANEELRRGRRALIDMLEPYFAGREAAREYVDEVLKIPSKMETEISIDTDDARSEIRDYIDELARIPGQFTTYLNAITRFIVEEHGVNAPTPNRYGGLYARNGLVNMGTSQLFPAGDRTLYGFREPGTGGEAFVARNAPRDRSLSILDTAARWHQAAVVPMEQAAASMASATSGGSPLAVTIPVEIPIYIGDEVVRVVRQEIRLTDRDLRRRAGQRA